MDGSLPIMAAEKLTVEDFYTYLRRGGASGKKPCSDLTIKKGYRNAVTVLMKTAGLPKDATLHDIRSLRTEQWHEYLDKYAGAAHNLRLVYINVFRKWLKLTPLQRGKHDVDGHEPLNLKSCEDAYERMYAKCTNDRDRALLAMMRYGGLRIGEVELQALLARAVALLEHKKKEK